MAEKARDLSDRFLDYGTNIIKICLDLSRNSVGRKVVGQLFDSGTSTGANYEEAKGAESKADFVHKLKIVLKELNESNYWLKLSKRSALTRNPLLDELIDETTQLTKIIAKSIVTTLSGM
jgi:four helix bundle protein